MKVVVDTPIWSYALRSKRGGYERYVEPLQSLIADQRVILLGQIRQEVLSGYSDLDKFEKLEKKLRYFENTLIIDDDYVNAAKFSNICRKNGIQGSHIDLLICSVSVRLGAQIFTSDKDFTFYKNHLPIALFSIDDTKSRVG